MAWLVSLSLAASSLSPVRAVVVKIHTLFHVLVRASKLSYIIFTVHVFRYCGQCPSDASVCIFSEIFLQPVKCEDEMKW